VRAFHAAGVVDVIIALANNAQEVCVCVYVCVCVCARRLLHVGKLQANDVCMCKGVCSIRGQNAQFASVLVEIFVHLFRGVVSASFWGALVSL
jgi:hypothetical protein